MMNHHLERKKVGHLELKMGTIRQGLFHLLDFESPWSRKSSSTQAKHLHRTENTWQPQTLK